MSWTEAKGHRLGLTKSVCRDRQHLDGIDNQTFDLIVDREGSQNEPLIQIRPHNAVDIESSVKRKVTCCPLPSGAIVQRPES
jgi:hypothetical protein